MYQCLEYDYVLPSNRVIRISARGVYWPKSGEVDHLSIEFVNDCIDKEIEMELMAIEEHAAQRIADA